MTIHKLAAVAFLMTAATIGWGQSSTEDHAAHHPPAKAPATASGPETSARKMMESENDLAATRALLERAEQAKSPSDRERLLGEHLAAMRGQLAALKSQQCEMEKMAGGAMGGARDEAATPGKMGDGMKNGHMMMCHRMMESRINNLVELLEQTWRRDELRKRSSK